jgi:hypothetical protein
MCLWNTEILNKYEEDYWEFSNAFLYDEIFILQVSLLSCPWVWQLYRIEIMHPPGHFVKVAVLTGIIKRTSCRHTHTHCTYTLLTYIIFIIRLRIYVCVCVYKQVRRKKQNLRPRQRNKTWLMQDVRFFYNDLEAKMIWINCQNCQVRHYILAYILCA